MELQFGQKILPVIWRTQFRSVDSDDVKTLRDLGF